MIKPWCAGRGFSGTPGARAGVERPHAIFGDPQCPDAHPCRGGVCPEPSVGPETSAWVRRGGVGFQGSPWTQRMGRRGLSSAQTGRFIDTRLLEGACSGGTVFLKTRFGEACREQPPCGNGEPLRRSHRGKVGSVFLGARDGRSLGNAWQTLGRWPRPPQPWPRLQTLRIAASGDAARSPRRE